ncbi:hypothetical protein PTSG_03174 [Salpingoeca rosetta]|uniref:Uncharacterized protein n=1 Tax=Salpingoeca rosetta (strain ATCC 50818 / BSB-021) TaxID=946362 RepID=F2U4F8_SALR5|nr:uncharacterized protein PTSG_03174 [Salpingoeca rosetta]EGD82524.1 hypothetical protein PTSG_03174 [Salpingoeca rosetta]|eukprot:XP_004995760.1 hypothetical protein PTSG_03174 [Salpingoeca rosetta]
MSGCVREEVDTLTREYEWLVATELPSMFKDIGRLLEAIVAQLAPDPRTTRPSRIPISCPNGHLRGHVVVLGACVTQAEVERRLPKKGNTSGNPTEFSTRIDSDTPYHEVRQAKQPFMLGGSMKGYVFKHRDTWMVVDAEEIGLCEVPTFSSVLGLLHDAQHLTQAVTSQLSVFQALDADLQRHGHVRGLNSPTTVETA